MARAVLLNIGNTHVQSAWYDGDCLSCRGSDPTSSLLDGKLPQVCHDHMDAPWLVASVVPRAAATLADLAPDRRIGATSLQLAGDDAGIIDKKHSISAGVIVKEVAAHQVADLDLQPGLLAGLTGRGDLGRLVDLAVACG